MAAAHVVTALQAIAARETDPLSSAVVSVTMFHAGDAYNVIPQGARIGAHYEVCRPAVCSRSGTASTRWCTPRPWLIGATLLLHGAPMLILQR